MLGLVALTMVVIWFTPKLTGAVPAPLAGIADLFDLAGDPEIVIVDFMNSRLVDHSALQVLEALASRYEGAGKTVQLRHLSTDCHHLLQRAGQLMVGSDDDPQYGLAVDYDVRTGILGGGLCTNPLHVAPQAFAVE